MKKFLCFVSAVCMVLSLTVVASAAPGGNGMNNSGFGQQQANPNDSTLQTSTTLISDVKYYVQLNGLQADTKGNVSSHPTSYYTGVVHTTTIADTSLTSSDSITVEQSEDGSAIANAVADAPDDSDIFVAVANDFQSKGYIKDNAGNVVPWSSLTTDNYRMHWYTLKYESSDGWHVDGRIIDLSTEEAINVVVPDDPSDIPDEAYATPVPTTEPTEEPTVEPTAEPTVEPTEEPANVNTYNGHIALDNDYAYIFGRNDTAMEPEDGMKRGEAAAVLYRLLKQNNDLGSFSYDQSNTPIFSDTNGRWDRSALEYMSYIGVYPESEKISPDAYITRGEAFKEIAIALRFTDNTSLSEDDYAAILKDGGFIEGDDNGNLALDRNINRAEFCKIYNEIIGRDEMSLETEDGEVITPETYGFTDISSSAWYYEDILKATSAYDDNGHVDLAKRGIRNVLDDYS